jgi:hypothetical protein
MHGFGSVHPHPAGWRRSDPTTGVPGIAGTSSSPPRLEALSRIEQLGIGGVATQMLPPKLEAKVAREHASAIAHTARVGG